MSLLDDVSIVVTPNGYKAGTLYGVLPTATLGSDLASGYDFTSGWNVFGGGTTITNNTSFVSQSGQGIYAGLGIVANKTYKIKITGTQPSGGYFSIKAGTTGTSFGNINGTSFNETIYATPTVVTGVGNDFYIRLSTHSAGTTITITDLEVQEWTASDMDVTRATAATRVDENGLVNYAEVLGSELVINGHFTTDISNWTTNLTRGSYQWDNGKAKITNDAASGYPNMSQNITTEVGKAYKVNATVEIGTATLVEVRIYDGAVLGSQQLTADGEIEFRFTAVGTTPTLLLYLFEAGNTGHYCYFDNVSVKQEDRNNVPRIDYTGGGCPHILAEPQRTNTVTYSEDFSQYSTGGTAPTLTTGQLAPDGTLNATKVSGVIGSTSLYRASESSTTATRSIYARTVSGTGTASLMSYHGNTNNTFTITEEWQRFELTGSIATGGANFYAIDFRDNSTTLSELIIWGGQSEEATYATSYIPTSGGTVTRNQDEFTRDGISSLINSTEGVLFVEMAALSNDLTYRILSLSNGTPNERVYIQYTNVSNTISAVVKTGGSTQFNKTYVLSDETAFSKIAVKWKLNDFALWVDGVERATGTSGNPPSGLNRLAFDNADITNFFGKVRQLQVYKTALTDAQLTSLTT